MYTFNLFLWCVGLSMVRQEQDPCADFGFKGLIYITTVCIYIYIYIKSNISLKLPLDISVSFSLYLSHSHKHSLTRMHAYNNIYNIGSTVLAWHKDYSLGTWVFVEIAPLGCVVAFQSTSIYTFMYLFIYLCRFVCTFASISYTLYAIWLYEHIYICPIGSNRI